jgi:hypothetical protein
MGPAIFVRNLAILLLSCRAASFHGVGRLWAFASLPQKHLGNSVVFVTQRRHRWLRVAKVIIRAQLVSAVYQGLDIDRNVRIIIP